MDVVDVSPHAPDRHRIPRNSRKSGIQQYTPHQHVGKSGHDQATIGVGTCGSGARPVAHLMRAVDQLRTDRLVCLRLFVGRSHPYWYLVVLGVAAKASRHLLGMWPRVSAYHERLREHPGKADGTNTVSLTGLISGGMLQASYVSVPRCQSHRLLGERMDRHEGAKLSRDGANSRGHSRFGGRRDDSR